MEYIIKRFSKTDKEKQNLQRNIGLGLAGTASGGAIGDLISEHKIDKQEELVSKQRKSLYEQDADQRRDYESKIKKLEVEDKIKGTNKNTKEIKKLKEKVKSSYKETVLKDQKIIEDSLKKNKKLRVKNSLIGAGIGLGVGTGLGIIASKKINKNNDKV